MIHFDTVEQYNNSYNNPTLHPLISCLDFSLGAPRPRESMHMGIYIIVLKNIKCGDLRYGNAYYEYDQETLLFFAPGQILHNEPLGEIIQPRGQALAFHPDLLKGSPLARQIHHYHFFSYQSRVALYTSANERAVIQDCFDKIKGELQQGQDRHSQKLLLSNLELLLTHCSRFFDRQQKVTEAPPAGVLERFHELLRAYFTSEKYRQHGLPSVAYFAGELNLSANYFGDLVKRETGKSALELIHLQLIDAAKERIFDTQKSVSQIAYELGFKYPQHFNRFFKQKTGQTPIEYRSLH